MTAPSPIDRRAYLRWLANQPDTGSSNGRIAVMLATPALPGQTRAELWPQLVEAVLQVDERRIDALLDELTATTRDEATA